MATQKFKRMTVDRLVEASTAIGRQMDDMARVEQSCEAFLDWSGHKAGQRNAVLRMLRMAGKIRRNLNTDLIAAKTEAARRDGHL